MFICLENPLTLYKCMILVSTKRSGDEYWYVKQSNDTRYVSSSGSYLSPSTLTRLAYTASKEGKKEVLLFFKIDIVCFYVSHFCVLGGS